MATTSTIIASLITIELPPGFSTGGVSETGTVSGAGAFTGCGSTGGGGITASGVTGGVTGITGSCVLTTSGSILNINCFSPTMSIPVLKKRRQVYKELIIYLGLLLLMVLSSFSIYNFLKINTVLGISTTQMQEQNLADGKEFWTDFLSRNPSYIPGWIEIGRTDRVKEIDPNYF